jgi:hypothetical protein
MMPIRHSFPTGGKRPDRPSLRVLAVSPWTVRYGSHIDLITIQKTDRHVIGTHLPSDHSLTSPSAAPVTKLTASSLWPIVAWGCHATPPTLSP